MLQNEQLFNDQNYDDYNDFIVDYDENNDICDDIEIIDNSNCLCFLVFEIFLIIFVYNIV